MSVCVYVACDRCGAATEAYRLRAQAVRSAKLSGFLTRGKRNYCSVECDRLESVRLEKEA
jgi:hypothetical protein